MDHPSSSPAPWSRPGEDPPEDPPEDPQIVLRSSTLKAVDHRCPADGRPGWWGVRCPRCRVWLTRYDFSAEDSLSIARGVLASGLHQCGRRVPDV